jgi:hypothetical protein
MLQGSFGCEWPDRENIAQVLSGAAERGSRRSIMALAQTSSISPVVPAPGTERQTVAPAEPTARPSAPVAAAQSAPQPPSAPVSGAIGFTLTFDPETQRMILEARDAATGFVIDQMPPKYVVKQFSAQVSARVAPSRGTRIDNAS